VRFQGLQGSRQLPQMLQVALQSHGMRCLNFQLAVRCSHSIFIGAGLEAAPTHLLPASLAASLPPSASGGEASSWCR
jgi:hypothetical protein